MDHEERWRYATVCKRILTGYDRVQAERETIVWQSGTQTRAYRDWLAIFEALLLVAAAIILWLAALPSINLRNLGDLGLVTLLPLPIYAALGLLILSFAISVHAQPLRPAILFLHVVTLIVIIHGTPVLLYGTLRYSWAWKHVGIIDFIQRYGVVDPTIDILGVYHNWPGFFTANALLTQLTGLDTLRYAAWAPVFFNLINLGALLLIFRTATTDRRVIWVSIWLFFIANWVGQDYFSPQALNFFLHLMILAICLNWFRQQPSYWIAGNSSRLPGWVSGILRRLAGYRIPASDIRTPSQPEQRVGLLMVVIILFLAVASSHQLTPLMTIASVTLLVMFGLCSARSLPILFLILAVTWIIFPAVTYARAVLESIVEAFGQIFSNIEGTLINLAIASPGQQLVAYMGRGLTAAILGLFVLGVIRRMRKGYLDLHMLLLVIAPFSILAVSFYGGEMLFRVYFFALPFLAYFAASALFPTLTSGRGRLSQVLLVVVSAGLLVGLLFAYYGKERQYYFTPNEVAASEFLYNIAPPNSLLVEGARNYPSQFRNYEYFTYVAIDREDPMAIQRVLAAPAPILAAWLSNDQYAAAYVFITRSQKAGIEMLGEMPTGSLDDIEQALRESPVFEILYENEDAVIFQLAGS